MLTLIFVVAAVLVFWFFIKPLIWQKKPVTHPAQNQTPKPTPATTTANSDNTKTDA